MAETETTREWAWCPDCEVEHPGEAPCPLCPFNDTMVTTRDAVEVVERFMVVECGTSVRRIQDALNRAASSGYELISFIPAPEHAITAVQPHLAALFENPHYSQKAHMAALVRSGFAQSAYHRARSALLSQRQASYLSAPSEDHPEPGL